MKRNMHLLGFSIMASCFIVLQGCGKSETAEIVHDDKDKAQLIKLENENVVLTVAQQGGAYVNFHLKADSLNPFTWKLSSEQMPPNNKNGAIFQGHFLCVGRWGSPSEGEIAAGVPHNGEPSNDSWEILHSGPRLLKMKVDAPLDGLEISRTVTLFDEGTAFQVDEEIKNVRSNGRISNIVQHGTVGAPFLQASTVINTNAGKGFMQSMSYPDPHAYAFSWPQGYADSLRTPVDLSSSATETSYVATHIFEHDSEEDAWITAATPEKGLLLGYCWKAEEYPWLNVWHQMEDGKPVAKGLEFGTTGIGRSYEELLAVDTRFYGQNSFEYIDAGEVIKKSFICFLIKIPEDFQQVANVRVLADKLVLEEDNKGTRRLYEIKR